MRPRVFPAEDPHTDSNPYIDTHASMRPRVFPAEDAGGARAPAAAGQASMRPRVFPAEDDWEPAGPAGRSGFNEAAGIPRGRPPGEALVWGGESALQ